MSPALEEPRVIQESQRTLQAPQQPKMSSFPCIWENTAGTVSLTQKEDGIGEIKKEFPNQNTVCSLRDRIILDCQNQVQQGRVSWAREERCERQIHEEKLWGPCGARKGRGQDHIQVSDYLVS